MALTFPKWLAATAVGCAVAGALASRATDEQPAPVDQRRVLERVAGRAQSHATRAAERLRVVQVKDSLTVGSPPGGDTSTWRIDPKLPPGIQQALTSLQVRSRQFRPARAVSPIDVVFVLDSASTVRGIRRSSHTVTHLDIALPVTASDRCTAIVRINPPAEARPTFYQRGQYRALSTDYFAHNVVGLCGFYEWFGPPGAEIDRWLRDGAWAYGQHAGAWHRAARPWRPWNRWWNYSAFGAREAGWPLRDFVTASAYRCLAGDEDRCEQLTIGNGETALARPDTLNPVWERSFVTPVRELWASDRNGFVLGPMEAGVLSYFVHKFGEERFRRFWTSNQPLGTAFREATGTAMGPALVRWANDVYGVQRRGPGVHAGASGGAVVLGVIAIALAIRTARRREIR